MLTISSGHSADYLTGPVAHGRESYYTGAVDAGEPPGRWSGQYAAAHGLVGEVDHQDMSALFKSFIDPADPRFRTPTDWAEARTLGRPPRRYAGPELATEALLAAEPDATPERRAEIRQEAARGTRHPVAFHDATYSVQKSITVAHAAFEAQEVAARTVGDTDAADAWMAHRLAIEDAIWAGNAAALEYLTDHAGYSRVGHHSTAGGRYIDAHDFTIASFFQHTNRENEPQLHIHNAILNRVPCSDGEWRTVDSRALYRYRGGAGAIAERVTEEHLTRSLGLTFRTRPDGKAREIVGGPALEKAMEMFSTRRRAITGKSAQLVEAYRTRFDREPTPLELDRLQRRATFATRKAKSHDGETLDERLDRWHRSLRAELAGGLRQVAHDIVDRRQAQPEPPTFSPSAVIETALADVQAGRATYNQGDLTRAISDALPDHLGADGPAMVRRLVEALVAEALQPSNVVDLTGPAPRALPEELRRADGRSMYEAPAGTRYSTADHMDSERALRQATVETGAPALDKAVARAFVVQLADEWGPLGEDQAAAVTGFLTSGARIEALLGPAGTGKSYTIAAMTRAWQDPGLCGGLQRRVFGLASSQVATDVLADEGVRARNVARWLATQERLAAGRNSAEDADWRLAEGDVVFVDESAMASTADLTAVHRHAAAARAKLVMVGDPRQLAAIGPGGAMAMVAGHGRTYELADVRRFDAEWERAASLRLRDGDQTVLPTYHKHGRLVDGGNAEDAAGAAARGWLADTLAGKRSTLTVDTNEQALALSARLRAQLVDLGRVEEAGVPLTGGLTAGVGDLVQARRNAWHLAGFEGNTRGPINRETYTVTEVRDDGGLVARRADCTPITLPGSYVAEHVSLGYVSTVHSAQGMTVDTAHCVVTSRSSAGSLYVAMTRGRHCNTAYVQTVVEQEDAPPGDGWKAGRRDPAAVVADVLEREQESMSALAEQAQLDEEARSLRTIGARLAGETEMIAVARTSRTLDELAAAGHIGDTQRVQMAADPAMGPLARLLRSAELAGHDPARTLTDAVTSRPLDGAESAARVLHSRISTELAGRLSPRGDTFVERLPAAEGLWSVRMGEWAEMADDRRRQLGDELTVDPPRWATTTFGPVPDDPMHRAEWQARASTVAAYREMNDVTGNDAALGPAPKPGQVEAHAAWHAAWRAMGRPEADREEAEMSNGQLRMRVRAYQREENWAPAYVADEMEGTHREVAELRQRQTLALAGSGAWTEADAAALAALEEGAADLRAADDVRAAWYVHTSPTRASADRARAELFDRGLDPDQPDDAVTPAEWLDANEADQAEADHHRPIHAQDLARHRPAAEDVHPDAAETAVPDVRDTSAPRPARADEGTARIPSADETAAAVERAQAALVEIRNRRAQEEEARSTYETEPADWAQEAHDAAALQVAVDEELVEV